MKKIVLFSLACLIWLVGSNKSLADQNAVITYEGCSSEMTAWNQASRAKALAQGKIFYTTSPDKSIIFEFVPGHQADAESEFKKWVIKMSSNPTKMLSYSDDRIVSPNGFGMIVVLYH